MPEGKKVQAELDFSSPTREKRPAFVLTCSPLLNLPRSGL